MKDLEKYLLKPQSYARILIAFENQQLKQEFESGHESFYLMKAGFQYFMGSQSYKHPEGGYIKMRVIDGISTAQKVFCGAGINRVFWVGKFEVECFLLAVAHTGR